MSKVILPLRPGNATCRVERWRLLQTYRALHLFGLFPPHTRFWVTPAIVSLDALERIALAEDGVAYRLAGEPGSRMLAAQFVTWCAAFDGRLEETRDVTDTLFGKAYGQQRIVGAICVAALQTAWPHM